MKACELAWRARSAVLALIAGLSFAWPAQAELVITVSTGPGGTGTILGTATDGNAGPLPSGSTTQAQANLHSGGINGQVTATAGATPTVDTLTVQSALAHTVAGSQTVYVTVTETYASPMAPPLTGTNTFNSVNGTNSQVLATINGNNVGTLTPLSTSGPYSFVTEYQITWTQRGASVVTDVISLNGTVVPEPPTILFSSMFAGTAFGAYEWFRRRKLVAWFG